MRDFTDVPLADASSELRCLTGLMSDEKSESIHSLIKGTLGRASPATSGIRTPVL